eukprot:TRINITY_DN1537_c0_g1_i1.p1 TRINITY_DN1537_c0_g1~~TRINITY_DN1537_c0_g1_i1.p1  ORF type:complete len:999 (+),score=317.95 TRINITY_DN1537_c0_g1_i1:43-2997(+)
MSADGLENAPVVRSNSSSVVYARDLVGSLIHSSEIDPRGLFKLKKKIGKGSFGKIWMGIKIDEDGIARDHDQVAVKVLPYEESNEDMNKKLGWEIRVMMNSKGCNNIIQFVGGYLEQKKKHKHLWIVMDFCENGSLRSYMNNVGPFKEKVIAPILKHTLQGLAFLHKSSTAHRDLKSANILWNAKGQVKIADLGEAVVLNEKEDWGDDMFTGTPYFMAPEVSSGNRYTEKIDIYSLGVMAIELAEVNPPYFSDPPFKVIFQIASQLLVPSLTKPSEYSAEFRDFISKCIQFDPEKRASTADLLQHPFILAADEPALCELAQQYHEATGGLELPAAGDKDQPSTKMINVVYKDKITGETLEQYFNNLLKWKENNLAVLEILARVGTAPKEPSTPNLSASNSKLKSFFKGLFKDSDLKMKVEKLSVMIHIAWKASSPSFGVILSDRSLNSRVYDKCFVGREMVDWLYQHLQLDHRNEAVNIFRHLIYADLVFGITETSSFIDSEHNYFRFRSAKIKEWHDSYAYSQTFESAAAYRNTSKDADKEKPTDDELIKSGLATQNTELTERDWAIIMSGANPEKFKRDEVVVQQGVFNRCIFRVVKGKVRAEKDENGKAVVLSRIEEGQMFGEMSVLTQGKTSATIRADSSPCEIFRAEVSFMYHLFQTEPGMQQRFFKRASVALAQKLRELGNANKPKPIIELEESDSQAQVRIRSPSSISSTPSGSPNTNARDKKYTYLFGLPSTEVVIQEGACYLQGLFKEHGKLYVSSNYVCFFAKVFGKTTKVAVELDKVTTEVTEKRQLVIRGKKQKLKLCGLSDPNEIATLITSLRSSKKASKESSSIYLSNSGQHEEDVLSSADWSLLLSESKCKTFAKGQMISKEGEWAAKIHQIAKGSCCVEKTDADLKVTKLGEMEAGEIFGEISFLEGVKTTASVVANEDNTEVYIIEGAALSVLFSRQPALSGRFYRYLAQILSARLKERERQLARKK